MLASFCKRWKLEFNSVELSIEGRTIYKYRGRFYYKDDGSDVIKEHYLKHGEKVTINPEVEFYRILT